MNTFDFSSGSINILLNIMLSFMKMHVLKNKATLTVPIPHSELRTPPSPSCKTEIKGHTTKPVYQRRELLILAAKDFSPFRRHATRRNQTTFCVSKARLGTNTLLKVFFIENQQEYRNGKPDSGF